MHRLPSSLTVTDTFFKVLFPQCEQNTRLMSDVVLEQERTGSNWSHKQQAPSPELKVNHRTWGEPQEMGKQLNHTVHVID